MARQIVTETIRSRRSVRKYKEQQLPIEMIDDLLEAAFAAPFSVGCHALRIMVIRDRKLLTSLSDAIKESSVDFIKKGRRFLRWRIPILFPMGIVPFLNFNTVMAQFLSSMKMKQDLWWGAPTLLLMCAKKDSSPTYEIDVAAAMENVTLMATSYGLGTCIVKWTELINFYPVLRSIISLHDGWWVIVGICVGYPLDTEKPQARPPRPSIVDLEYVQWRESRGGSN
jgi:nitroreductase